MSGCEHVTMQACPKAGALGLSEDGPTHVFPDQPHQNPASHPSDVRLGTCPNSTLNSLLTLTRGGTPRRVKYPTMRTIITSFVAADIDATDWSQLEPLLNDLLERPVTSPAELEQWLLDRSELDSAIDETGAELHIATTCDTDDEQATAAYMSFIENVVPRLKPLAFELDKRFVELASQHPIDEHRYEVLLRNKRAAVELFREENVPIQTDLSRLSQEHGKVTGGMTVEYRDETRTLPQMSVFIMDRDRAVREEAWRLVAARRMQDREALDDLLDQMIELRHRMGENAGFIDHEGVGPYVQYEFVNKQRFDYTPDDCESYAKGIELHIMPLIRRFNNERRESLGIDNLRPWDLACDRLGRDPMRPFDGGRDLINKTISTLRLLDPRLADLIQTMASDEGAASDSNGHMRTDYLDLDSRPAKRPGGYMSSRERTGRPFIFMNAAGVHRDLETMVHESGHAIHTMLCTSLPLLEDRDYATEIAEVASMALEHLSMPHWQRGGFYPDDADFARARRDHIESAITVLAWIATIDSFQRWMYANPTHTRQEREDHWLELDNRFGHELDWSGLETERRTMWQRQPHIYSAPMYYIEYGIAQLGALQLWLKSRAEGEPAAVDAYLRALALGGSRPLPDLFQAADISFDFGPETIGRVAGEVTKALDEI